MPELLLTRAPTDRRLYQLDGVGTLRMEGLFSRWATAKAGALAWELRRRGAWRRLIEAVDAAGSVVGRYSGRAWSRGGSLHWSDRELELRRDSAWHHRYQLIDGARNLATIEGKNWGRRPVSVTDADLNTIDPGLLLFAVFVVRVIVQDAQAASGAAVAASSGAMAGG